MSPWTLADLITFAVACCVGPIYVVASLLHAERVRLRRYAAGGRKILTVRSW